MTRDEAKHIVESLYGVDLSESKAMTLMCMSELLAGVGYDALSDEGLSRLAVIQRDHEERELDAARRRSRRWHA